jgi:peptide/nickel transport system permease protein
MIDSRTISNLKKEFKRSRTAQIGVVIFVVLLVVGVFAPVIAPHDPTEVNTGNKLMPPAGLSVTETESVTNYSDGEVTLTEREVTRSGSLENPLGTNALGQDIFSRVVYGTRTSMLVGLLGTGISATIGVVIGLISGYFRGRLDDLLMRFADVMLALPSLIFAIVMIGLFGSQSIQVPDPFVYFGLIGNRPESFPIPTTLIIVIAVVNWVTFARVARGEAISVANEEHVKSAKALGAGHWEILKTHIFPNSVTPILVYATINIAFVILIESGLSFLGFTSTKLSWGFNIAQGRDYLGTSWWIAAAPGIAIMMAVFSVNLIGDWLRDSLDPGMQETRQS